MWTEREADIKEGVFEKVALMLSPKDEEKSSKSGFRKRRGHIFLLWTLHMVEESATFTIGYFFFPSYLSNIQKHKGF